MRVILNKFTLLDYPGEMAAIVFFYGCNLKCPYCYNLDCYYKRETARTYDMSAVIPFLHNRTEKLTAVVFSGGEPLLSGEAFNYLRTIKDLGFKTKLFTNGTRPDKLVEWIPYLDAVDMSIKTTPEKYPLIGDDGAGIKESIELIKHNFTDYHFNAVTFPVLCTDKETIAGIISLVGDLAVMQKRLTFIEPKLDVPVLMDEMDYAGLPWGKDYKRCLRKAPKSATP